MKSQSKPANPVVAWLKEVDQYCFGYGSATTLGIFRILFGFWVFVNYLMLLPFWEVWFSEKGYVPNWMGHLWFRHTSDLPSGLAHFFPIQLPRLDLLNGVTDPRISLAFYIGVMVFAVLTCFGIATRFSAFFLFLGVISLHHHNGAILHGGDTLMRLMVIYMAVSPCGRACSVDRLIALWRGTESHQPEQVSIWSQRLIAFNIAMLYFTTVWFKWDGDKWRTLIGTYYPEHLAEFYRFPVPEFFKSAWMARVTTLGTILTEFSLGTLVFFPPARKYVLLAGILMHSYIEYSMNIPLFSYLMISTYVVFYQGEEITAWALRLGLRMRKFHVEVRLPSGMKLNPRGAALFSAIDPFGLVTFLPGAASSVSAHRNNEAEIGLNWALFSRCVGAWPFLWIPKLPTTLLNKCLEKEIEEKQVERPELPVEHRQEKAIASTAAQTRKARRGSLKA